MQSKTKGASIPIRTVQNVGQAPQNEFPEELLELLINIGLHYIKDRRDIPNNDLFYNNGLTRRMDKMWIKYFDTII